MSHHTTIRPLFSFSFYWLIHLYSPNSVHFYFPFVKRQEGSTHKKTSVCRDRPTFSKSVTSKSKKKPDVFYERCQILELCSYEFYFIGTVQWNSEYLLLVLIICSFFYEAILFNLDVLQNIKLHNSFF